jgi:hypothetical protein
MTRMFGSKRIRALTRDQRILWFTVDDRWSADPAQAERIEDEAHADIRLLDAEIRAPRLAAVGLVDAVEIQSLAS